MSSENDGPAAEFERLSRQYWNAWAQFAPRAEAAPAVPGLKEGLAFWTQLAAQGQGRGDIDAMLQRMNAQAGDWFGAMQSLAAGQGQGSATAAQIRQAWQQMLGGAEGNPVAAMFQRMAGPGVQGIDSWVSQATPLFDALRGEQHAMLELPAFGQGREHQERLQHLARAQLDYQDGAKAYAGQLARAGQLAFERFESKLGERSEPGRQIESARALFDLWIDAAEEAWGEVALSVEFREVYGTLVNSQMRLRAAMQREVELATAQFGLPTRSEMNASHRKVAALERELRALRAQLAPRASSTVSVAAAPEAGVTTSGPRARVATSKAKPAVGKSRAKSGAGASPARTGPRAKAPAASPATSAVPARASRKSRAKAPPAKPKKMLPQVAIPRAVGASAKSRVPARSTGKGR